MDETRVLNADERALVDWFFREWLVLGAFAPLLPPETVAKVFINETDGYRTLSLPFIAPYEGETVQSPYLGEAVAEIDGRHFNAMLFSDSEGVMIEIIYAGDGWPIRMPKLNELRAVWMNQEDKEPRMFIDPPAGTQQLPSN